MSRSVPDAPQPLAASDGYESSFFSVFPSPLSLPAEAASKFASARGVAAALSPTGAPCATPPFFALSSGPLADAARDFSVCSPSLGSYHHFFFCGPCYSSFLGSKPRRSCGLSARVFATGPVCWIAIQLFVFRVVEAALP